MALPFYRLKSIFDNDPSAGRQFNFNFIPQDDQQQPSPAQSNSDDFASTYARLAGMEGGPAQRKYRQFLEDNAPQKSDFNPSKTQRIAAILAGVSEGVKRGGGAGVATTNDILDQDYQDAMKNYALQGDKLAKAADLENKDVNNRVKTFRDIEEFNRNTAKDQADADYKKGVLAHYERSDKNAADANSSRGWNFFDDKTTGNRFAVKPNATGRFDKLNLGPAALTPDQEVTFEGKKAGARAKAELPYQKDLENTRHSNAVDLENTRFQNSKDLITFRDQNPDYHFETDSKGTVIAVNPKKPKETINTGINTGKLSDKDKADLQLQNSIKLKQTAPPDRTTTTESEISKGGKKRNTKTNTTYSGNSGRIKVIGPNGQTGTIDASELEEALKHGWKKAG